MSLCHELIQLWGTDDRIERGGLRSDNEMLLRRVEVVKLEQILLNLLASGKIIQRWSNEQLSNLARGDVQDKHWFDCDSLEILLLKTAANINTGALEKFADGLGSGPRHKTYCHTY